MTAPEIVEARFDDDGIANAIEALFSLYSDPYVAALREYAANALDAHREAGTDRPVEVMLTRNRADDTVTLTVNDYGLGMTRERMSTVFAHYVGSDKRADAKKIGGFGIGAKAALATAPDFTVVTRAGDETTAAVVSYEGGGRLVTVLVDDRHRDLPGTTVEAVMQEVDLDQWHRLVRYASILASASDAVVSLSDGAAAEVLDRSKVTEDRLLAVFDTVMAEHGHDVVRNRFAGALRALGVDMYQGPTVIVSGIPYAVPADSRVGSIVSADNAHGLYPVITYDSARHTIPRSREQIRGVTYREAYIETVRMRYLAISRYAAEVAGADATLAEEYSAGIETARKVRRANLYAEGTDPGLFMLVRSSGDSDGPPTYTPPYEPTIPATDGKAVADLYETGKVSAYTLNPAAIPGTAAAVVAVLPRGTAIPKGAGAPVVRQAARRVLAHREGAGAGLAERYHRRGDHSGQMYVVADGTEAARTLMRGLGLATIRGGSAYHPDWPGTDPDTRMVHLTAEEIAAARKTRPGRVRKGTLVTADGAKTVHLTTAQWIDLIDAGEWVLSRDAAHAGTFRRVEQYLDVAGARVTATLRTSQPLHLLAPKGRVYRLGDVPERELGERIGGTRGAHTPGLEEAAAACMDRVAETLRPSAYGAAVALRRRLGGGPHAEGTPLATLISRADAHYPEWREQVAVPENVTAEMAVAAWPVPSGGGGGNAFGPYAAYDYTTDAPHRGGYRLIAQAAGEMIGALSYESPDDLATEVPRIMRDVIDRAERSAGETGIDYAALLELLEQGG